MTSEHSSDVSESRRTILAAIDLVSEVESVQSDYMLSTADMIAAIAVMAATYATTHVPFLPGTQGFKMWMDTFINAFTDTVTELTKGQNKP